MDAIYGPLSTREKALWQFTGGDYEKFAGLLAQVERPTPETLFLQGLCHDANGLKEPGKSRAFLEQIISAHPGDPLADEARKQLGIPAPKGGRQPRRP